MSISATSTTSGVINDVASNTAGYTAKAHKTVLDSSDFMTLLTTQMSNQDPMSPMDDTAFVSQMASFTSLSQMNTLVSDFSALKTETTKSTASSYIGRTVTVLDPDTDQSVTGEVTGVDYTEDNPRIKIGDSYYELSTIQQVAATTTTDTSG